jgi:hypothetical protein
MFYHIMILNINCGNLAHNLRIPFNTVIYRQVMLVVTDILEELATSLFMVEVLFHVEDYSLFVLQ